MDDDIALPQAVAPKQKDTPKPEPVDNSPSKPGVSGFAAKANPSASKSAKGKRKSNGDDAKASNSAPPKKAKTESVCIYLLSPSSSKSTFSQVMALIIYD